MVLPVPLLPEPPRWGLKGTHPAAAGMGTRRRKLFRVCFPLGLFRTREQTFPTSEDGEYSAVRFNLPFIHVLMRSSASLPRSCCWSFPNPFCSPEKPCKGQKGPWLPPCPTAKYVGPRAGGQRPPPSADPHRFRLQCLPRAAHFCALGRQAGSLMRDNRRLLPC